MGSKISKSKKKYEQGTADDRDNDTLGYSKLPSGKSTSTNSYLTPMTDGVENKRDFRQDTEKGCASNNTRLSGPRYNTKTGTYTGQRHNGRRRARLEQVFSDKTAVSRDAEIESIVKKYRMKIVKDIVVGHILPLMKTFIDTDEIDEIAEKDGNGAAMEALLDKIQNCKKKGRWQRFVDALRENNYDYIYNLLQGGSKKKETSVQHELLRILTPGIINRVNPVELARYLFSHKAINNYDLETIEREEQTKGKRSAASKLLNVVPCRSANWVQLLCDAMRAEGQNDLAEQFLVHYEEVSSNTEGPHTSSNSEFENTSEPSTPGSGLKIELRPQLPKRRPKVRSSRQQTKPSKVTYQNIRAVKLEEEIDSLRRKSILIEEKEQSLKELQRKEDKLTKKYGERPDFGFDLSELRKRLMVLEAKEQIMQELTKKENDFKIKFGKSVEDTEDNSELVKKLAALQTKMLLMEQIENGGEKLSHLEDGKKEVRKAKKLRSSDGYGTSNSSITDAVESRDLLPLIESIVSREVQRRFSTGSLEPDYQDIEGDFKLPRPHYTSDYYSFSTR